MDQAAKDAMRRALATRDQALLDALMLELAIFHVPSDEIENELFAALAEQDEETRRWWDGPCNCHGGLN